MLTPLEALDRALPDLDPELGDAYVAGAMGGVWAVLRARKERIPSPVMQAFEDEYNPYAAMYAFAQTE